MFGKTIAELADIIIKQETKMTREEAIKKFNDIMYTDDLCRHTDAARNLKWSEKAIAAYEALGLIKFEDAEPKKCYIFRAKTGHEYKILDEFLRVEI